MLGSCVSCTTFHQRAPRRFAYVLRRRGDLLLDAAVARNGGQYTTPPHDGGVHHQAAIGRKGRRAVELPVSEHLRLARRDVHQRQAVATLTPLDEGERLAVRVVARRDVVAALVCYALG